jgi:hypothetical protein
MEAARTSETLVNFYQTTRCYNPEDSNLQINISLTFWNSINFIHNNTFLFIIPSFRSTELRQARILLLRSIRRNAKRNQKARPPESRTGNFQTLCQSIVKSRNTSFVLNSLFELQFRRKAATSVHSSWKRRFASSEHQTTDFL